MSKRFMKIVCILLSLMMLLGVMPLSVFAEITQDESNIYLIGTAEELFEFAEIAKAKAGTALKARLTADINLNPGATFTYDHETGLVTVAKGEQSYKMGSGMKDTELGNFHPVYNGLCTQEQWDDESKTDEELEEYRNTLIEQMNEKIEALGLRKWTPIGTKTSPYIGYFDGNGHTIDGLYINDNTVYYTGLFGVIGNFNYISGTSDYGEVKDITIGENSLVVGYYAHTSGATGAIVGMTQFDKITGCVNYATVVGKGSNDLAFSNSGLVGGIVGYANNDVKNCTNYGTVVSRESAGGIAGNIMGNQYQQGNILYCANYGKVYAEAHADQGYAGGIAINSGDSKSEAAGCGGSVEACVNYGYVEGYYVGGVIYRGAQNTQVKYCANRGTVAGTSFASGVITFISNGGFTMEGCYNAGAVKALPYEGEGTVTLLKVFPLVASVDTSYSHTVKNCYNDETVCPSGGAIFREGVTASNSYGVTTEFFATGEPAYKMGSYDSKGWKQNIATPAEEGKTPETYPTTNGTRLVYEVTHYCCHTDDTNKQAHKKVFYSNVYGNITDEHTPNESGICAHCGADVRKPIFLLDTLPEAKVGKSYSVTIRLSDSAPMVNGNIQAFVSETDDTAYTFSNGLTGQADYSYSDKYCYKISGIPTETGTLTFTLSATNENGTTKKTYTLKINEAGPLEIDTEAKLDNGTVGESYSQTLLCDSTDLEKTWSIAEGSALPAGLTLSEDGTISGKPTTAGDYTFKIVVSAGTRTAEKTFTLKIFGEGGCKHPEGKMVKFPGTPATCKKDGIADYYHCNECDRDFLDAGGTEELGSIDNLKIASNHIDKNGDGKCDFCGRGIVFKKVTDNSEIVYGSTYIFVTVMDGKYYALTMPTEGKDGREYGEFMTLGEIVANEKGEFALKTLEDSGVIMLTTEFCAPSGGDLALVSRYGLSAILGNMHYGLSDNGPCFGMYPNEPAKYGYRITLNDSGEAQIVSVYSTWWEDPKTTQEGPLCAFDLTIGGKDNTKFMSFFTESSYSGKYDDVKTYPIYLYRMTVEAQTSSGVTFITNDNNSQVDKNKGLPDAIDLSNVNGIADAVDQTYMETLIDGTGTTEKNVIAGVCASIEAIEYTEDTSLKYSVTPKITITDKDGKTLYEGDIPDKELNGDPITVTLYTGFVPAQIVHHKEDGTNEYFYSRGSAEASAGKNTFEYDNGYVTFEVTSFSDITILKTALPETTRPSANVVSVDGKNFNSGRLYYKNGDEADNFTGSESDYNAHYDPETGVLTLNGYNGGRIAVGGPIESDIIIELVGTNIVTDPIVNSNGGDITIIGTGSLKIDVVTNSDDAYGIQTGLADSFKEGSVTIAGSAKVTINVVNNNTSGRTYGIFAKQSVTISESASVNITCKAPGNTWKSSTCYGIFVPDATSGGGVTIDTDGTITIDVKDAGADAYSYGVYAPNYTLTKVGGMTAEWKATTTGGYAFYGKVSFNNATHAINIDETNCYASYRYGTPYTVTVTNGSITGPGVKYEMDSGNFLKGDEITLTAPDRYADSAETIKIPFAKWVSGDVTVANATSQSGATFTMPGKNVAVTAQYNPFTAQPSFAKDTSYSNKGRVSFTLVSNGFSSTLKILPKNNLGAGDCASVTQNTSGASYECTVFESYCPKGEYVVEVSYNGTTYYSELFTVDYTAPVTHPDKPTIVVSGSYTYTGSDITAVVTGFDSATMTITGNVGTNAGNYTVSVVSKTGQWADGTTDAVTVEWTIAKADPTYTIPTGLTGTKGNALSTVALPSGWTWKAPTTVMDTVGDQTFATIYTPEDTENYNTKEVNVTVNVEGVAAVPTAITGLVYNGSAQQGVADGTGYTLAGHKQTKAGTYTATATLISGYKWSDGTTDAVTVEWTIAKADPTVTAPTGLTGTKSNALSTVALPSGWTWKAPTTVMDTVGDQTFAAIYTPTDTENYNTKEVDVTVKVKEIEYIIEVLNGKAYDSEGKEITKAVPGTLVTIIAQEFEAYLFMGWQDYDVLEGTITAENAIKFTDANSKKTTFIMPARNVSPFAPSMPDVESITIDKTEITLPVGGKIKITSTVVPAIHNDQVYWTSDNEAVATVSNNYGGVVEAKSVGTAIITAKAGDKFITCTVTVTEDKIVPIPTAISGLVYNRYEQQGVVDGGASYTITGHKQTRAGTYEAIATLNPGYTWSDGTTESKTITWTIARQEITLVVEVLGTYSYTGSPIIPEYEVKKGGIYILPKEEYTVSITENINAGTATITVSSSENGNYEFTAVVQTFTIGKGTQAKPTGIVGVACTGSGATDGKITGVTAAMEYRKEGATAWTKVTGTEITGLSVGNYEIRFAETENLSASDAVTITVTVHTHAFGTEWKHDETNHWHECSCGEKSDEATHTGGTATCQEKATCSVCGAKYGGFASHAFTKRNTAAKYLKSPATCTSKAVYYYSCAFCGATRTATFEYGEMLAHAFGEWHITKAATETQKGTKERICSECSFKETAEIPVLEHTHAFGTEWKKDGTNHWHECACGEKSESAAHTFGDWKITRAATEEANGVKERTCIVCSYQEQEEIPALGHTHKFGTEWKNDETSHWHECSCGERSESAAHTFAWKIDREATASSKGQKHEECTVCGYAKESVEIPVIAPTITAGANAKWNKDSKNNLHFTSDAHIEDFIAVLVDGEMIAEENYEKRSGSIIIELKTSYLETLAEGEHTLIIRSNGGDAMANFTIAKAESSSQTGSSVWIWIILGVIVLGGAGTAVYFVAKKKKQM